MRRPDKIQRKGGIRWQARYRDAHGVMRYETFPTAKQAGKRLREIEAQRDSGTPINADLPFAMLAEEWRVAHLARANNLRPSSVLDYEIHRKRLVEYFGQMTLRSITPRDVEAFVAELQRQERGVRTINKGLGTLRTILKFAVGRGYVSRNVASFVRMLKAPAKAAGSLDLNCLSPAEAQLLIDHIEPEWKAWAGVMCFGGLRLGESLGLQWGDVELDRHRIFVRRQLEGVTGELREPKTAAGTRIVELPASVVSELRRWKLRCPHGPLGLCFPARNGEPMDGGNLRGRVFHPALRRAGLRRIRLHDLRHTAASLLIATGADIAAVSRQLGHADVNVTLKTYTHNFTRRSTTGLGEGLQALIDAEAGCEMAATQKVAGGQQR